jgi:hypothetical protein
MLKELFFSALKKFIEGLFLVLGIIIGLFLLIKFVLLRYI